MIVGILAIMIGCSSGTSTKSIFDEEITEEIVEEVTRRRAEEMKKLRNKSPMNQHQIMKVCRSDPEP